MSGITLEQAQARLQAYLDAEAAVLGGQSYTINTAGNVRQLTRANLAEIRTGIEFWQDQVGTLTAKSTGRGRAVNVVPRW